ncbi:hypothetical protein KIH27_03320 [Mycobacterium sp. M1]|uniref:Uncharacterized protein n=1 Tax=Mycolicibacter acidiphilus TaxID=2835306 RepID=A0ABS5RGA4_9MYCO|nr:hypothetical protein [Mycolicibacter acidiphilus]MBS9532613.1 hypothetical protein [Mycolicibacter acidiphilus]
MFNTPELKRIKLAAEARGLDPFAVLMATLDALGDAVGLPIDTKPLRDPTQRARVTHLADQLAAEALGRLA